MNTVIRGILKPGDHVITSSMEHNSVMRPLRTIEKEGVKLSIIPCTGAGDIFPRDVIAAIKRHTKMIIVAHASNVTGTIMPIADVAEMARRHHVILCVDAAQTAGNIPIDVLRDNIDILVFTGHKSLYGPQGTGGFYVRKGSEKMVTPLSGEARAVDSSRSIRTLCPTVLNQARPILSAIAGLGAGAGYVAAIGVQTIRKKDCP